MTSSTGIEACRMEGQVDHSPSLKVAHDVLLMSREESSLTGAFAWRLCAYIPEG